MFKEIHVVVFFLRKTNAILIFNQNFQGKLTIYFSKITLNPYFDLCDEIIIIISI